MSDYIKRKEYKLPDGSAVTAYFDELGCAKITIQAMDALFDILNSSDVVEVVRCKDCKWRDTIPRFNVFLSNGCRWHESESPDDDDFCSYGERAEQ